jgi:hypothetical protein
MDLDVYCGEVTGGRIRARGCRLESATATDDCHQNEQQGEASCGSSRHAIRHFSGTTGQVNANDLLVHIDTRLPPLPPHREQPQGYYCHDTPRSVIDDKEMRVSTSTPEWPPPDASARRPQQHIAGGSVGFRVGTVG